MRYKKRFWAEKMRVVWEIRGRNEEDGGRP